MLPPIAVFAYNRPNHLASVLQSLDRSMKFFGHDFPLYIFCDAAKNSSQKEAVERTRKVALSQKDTKVILRETNQGFHNIVNGISEMCKKYGKVIVVEDDIIVSPDFLPFMTHALNFYENHQSVYMISGFMYHDPHPKPPFLMSLQTSFIWGWATWKRAWDHFSWEAEGWQEFLNHRKSRYKYDFFGSFPFSKILKETMTGQTSAWDPQWIFTLHKNNAYGIHPSRSLTWNCGIGGGSHGHPSLDENPMACIKEFYIHGNKQVSDFLYPQLPEEIYSGKAFSNDVFLDKKFMRRLALIFLKHRFHSETRKRKILFKMLKQSIIYPFSFLAKK